MTTLTYIAGIIWLLVVGALAVILGCFQLDSGLRTKLHWAMVALFTGPVALALWTLQRQKK